MACLVSSPSVLVRVGALWLAGLIAYSYLASIANNVFLCALYLDASEDVVPAGYDESMMHRAWKTRGVRA